MPVPSSVVTNSAGRTRQIVAGRRQIIEQALVTHAVELAAERAADDS